VTLFPALKGEKIDQVTIVSRLGSLDMALQDTILSPIGLQHDSTGLIRATILGLKIMDIAKQISHTKMFTRCQDVFGRYNVNEYTIDFCIKPGPDRTPPGIVMTEPASNTKLAYGTTSKEVSIYTNEPASCKWGKQDKSYS